jgi:branched-chain amino acid transport system ATP-binding protein
VPLLEVRDAHKHFGGVKALAGASLTIGEAEVVGLIGPNGSGKTTMFHCLSGFYRLDRGAATWRGHSVIRRRPDWLARAGLVRTFQHVSAFPEATVVESVVRAKRAHTSWGRRLPPNARIPEEPSEILDWAGLSAVGHRRVGELSYGFRRLTNVAMAVATQPWLLMLDEPGAGLDGRESGILAELVRRVQASGSSVLLIDHDIPLVSRVCQRVYVIDAGANVAHGTPSEIQHNPRVREVYLGSRKPGATAHRD